MSGPHKSKYDEHPFDPKAPHDDKTEHPDLGNTKAPELKVVWDRRPSFNLDPHDSGSSGESGQSPDASPFKIDLRDVAAQVDSMLATSRILVAEYQALKARVMNGKDTVFGQNSFIKHDAGSHAMQYGLSDSKADTKFAKPGQKFAASMNPIQDKVLQQIGATLELVGEYIASVNHSGQVYAYSDRHSRFPAPPNASA